MAAKLDIVFFLEGRHVPSSRFRVKQFEALLSADGIRYKFLYTVPSKYLFVPRGLKLELLRFPILSAQLAIVVLTRFVQILLYARRARVVFLQRDLLHGVHTPFLERILFWFLRFGRAKKAARVVFDVDDTIFRSRRDPSNRDLESKISAITMRCDTVIAGNKFLADFFANLCPSKVIPTTIDCERFQRKASKPPSSSKRLTIGWTGAAPNLPYLSPLEPVLLKLQSEIDFNLTIITEAGCKSPFSEKLRHVRVIAWLEHTEIDDLCELDIGLMPLPDDDWTRGKCGFKLLQYMALGIAAAASAVGVNSEIITHGENGFLANSLEEWETALRTLLTDSAVRARCALLGRKTVEERYAHSLWYPTWRDSIFGAHES